MSTENDDQNHADDTDQAASPVEDAAEPTGDVWQEATEPVAEEPDAEQPAADTEPVAEEPVAEPADDTEPVADEPAAEEEVPAEEPVAASADETVPEEVTGEIVDEEPAGEPRLSAVPDSEEPAAASAGHAGESMAEDAARQFISSVEGFLGNVFKDATEAVDKITSKGKEQARGGPERAADPTEFLESVESWVGDFFRGAPGKAARGFGKAAAGNAFRTASNNKNDVWASATTEDADRDASRECRYCPFCQTLAAVRNTRPDLYDQIGDTAKTLVDLVKQAAEQSRGRRPWR